MIKKLLFYYIKKNNNKYITSNTKRVGFPFLNKGNIQLNNLNEKIDNFLKVINVKMIDTNINF